MVEINVTSLVDVAFTLLIVFIILVPAMETSLGVAVPAVGGRAGRQQEEKPVSVTLAADGAITLDGTAVDGPDALLPATRGSAVDVRADAGVPYGTLAALLAALERADAEEIRLVTLPPAR